MNQNSISLVNTAHSVEYENFKPRDVELLSHPVLIHPMPLLSIVDHYSRSCGNTNKRVVGALLGESTNNQITVSNCYAVPFEEMSNEENIWFLDITYLRNMFAMYLKINANEKIIGWYSTASKFNETDFSIHQLFFEFTENPIFLLLNVNDTSMPLQTYYTFELTIKKPKLSFVPVPYTLTFEEVEETAVEHLLRDIKHSYKNYTLKKNVESISESLQFLKSSLDKIRDYFMYLINHPSEINNSFAILMCKKMQETINKMPQNINSKQLEDELYIESSLRLVALFAAHASKAVVANHNLIHEKLNLRNHPQET